MREIRVHGQDRRYHHPRLGINGRLDTLQAAVLLAKLEIFDDEVAARMRIGARYTEMIAEAFARRVRPGAPRDDSVARAGLHQRVRAVHRRSGRIARRSSRRMKAQGIPTAVHYPVPLHLQPVFADLGQGDGSFPVSEAAGRRVHQPADASVPDRRSAGARRASAAQRRSEPVMRQVVLDTETTGLEPEQGHRIIEIGCVELINRRKTGRTFHRYLRPDRRIDRGAQQVHGITDEFLRSSRASRDVVDELLEFISGAELVIHNAAFDVAFLDAELQAPAGPLRAG